MVANTNTRLLLRIERDLQSMNHRILYRAIALELPGRPMTSFPRSCLVTHKNAISETFTRNSEQKSVIRDKRRWGQASPECCWHGWHSRQQSETWPWGNDQSEEYEPICFISRSPMQKCQNTDQHEEWMHNLMDSDCESLPCNRCRCRYIPSLAQVLALHGGGWRGGGISGAQPERMYSL